MPERTRVLIVDDEEFNLYYLRALLEGNGYDVLTAADGSEALALAARDPPELVISDLLMPVMDGYTLLWQWRADASLRTIPFIVYTATYTEPEDERLALGLGADAFIVKPAEPELLLERVNAVLSASRGGFPSVAGVADDPALLRRYADVLFRKLDQKTMRLAEANQALQQDIEQRSRIESTLRANETMLRLACRVARMGGWTVDFASRAVTWSDEVCALHEAEAGFAPDFETALGFFTPESRGTLSLAVEACIAGRTSFDLELQIVTGRDNRIWVRVIGEGVIDADGSVGGIHGAMQDITEQKRSELALKEIENRFRLLGRATNDAIKDWDIVGGTFWWNEGFETLFGYGPDEVEPTLESWTSRIHPNEREGVTESLHGAIGSGEATWSREYQFARKDGSYAHVLDREHIIRDAVGRATRVVGGMTDISERKKLEAQFLRTQRMESIGTLAGGIAHDLNNVLLPISMAVGLLKLGEEDPDRMGMLDTIETGALRGADMVRQVLAFARGVEGKRVPVDIGRLVHDVGRIVRDTFPKNIDLAIDVPREARTVLADPTQIQQVLMNLCVNARDAMPDGGRLAITVGAVVLDEAAADIDPNALPGHYLTLSVSDTGIGMTPDVRDRIFEPFFTTKEIGRGTGLGLPTAMTILRSHSGFITLETALDRGTEFVIHLPFDPEQLTGDDTPLAPDALPRGNGETILIVDDEQGIRDVTKKILERFGYDAVVAANGREALAIFRDRQTPISAVLLDMAMPVMDGPATIEALRELDPSVRIIGSSGYSVDGSAGALGANVVAFIPKPYSVEVLLMTVSRAIDKPK